MDDQTLAMCKVAFSLSTTIANIVASFVITTQMDIGTSLSGHVRRDDGLTNEKQVPIEQR